MSAAASWTIVPAVTGAVAPVDRGQEVGDASPSGSASMNVATSTFVSGAPSVPWSGDRGCRSAARRRSSTVPVIVIVAVPGASSATSDGERERALLLVGVAALDGEVAAADVATTVPGGGRAVAPVDRGGEVGGRVRRDSRCR